VIVVESPGILTTVQDLGRPGFGAFGVSPSGAADTIALRVGNLLAGNPPGAAALEMTLSGGRYRFEVDAIVAITGAARFPHMWRAVEVRAGQTLDIEPSRSGARSYLCVNGGIEVERFLGSASTHLLSGLGGYRGRALKRGDRLIIGAARCEGRPRAVNPETLARLAPRTSLRVTHAPQSEWFTSEVRAQFVSTPYRVTQEADRMGLRLEGAPLKAQRGTHMLTEGVTLGAIQVPSGGQPIILFVEQQTTGGYPKIANVISADIPSVGQLRPGDTVRFEWVSIPTARAILFEQESLLAPETLFA
jgi:biotin-dependent carboxylase-like uncharacterized protein